MANVYKAMHVDLERQLNEAKAILAEENALIDCSPPFTQELPKENFPEFVLPSALGVRKCFIVFPFLPYADACHTGKDLVDLYNAEKKLTTSTDSARSEDSPILKHRQWQRKNAK